jgi:mono/diheme cytochrome c family protein
MIAACTAGPRLLLLCLRAGILGALAVGLAAACGSSSKSQGSDGAQRWAQKERLPKSALPGARVFEASHCTTCHTYAGSGTTVLHAPDLTAIGSHHLGVAFEIRHLRCPSCANPGSPMPPYAKLSDRKLRELAVFLEASKGIR